MSPQDVFQAVAFVSVVAPCVVSVAALYVPRPRRMLLRGAVAISAGWIADIALTIHAYNRAGTAAAAALGVDHAGMGFDNNTVAVAILGGGLYLTAAVGLALATGALIRRTRPTSPPGR
ncbi:hypothetical protein [Lysobacter sp. OAE881]|uniref:hypothetical protein n=1 Tax=Lysobacter sp. OAE881 TaxID=2663813 RepID=UPI00178AA79A